jgi:hypothetical protein
MWVFSVCVCPFTVTADVLRLAALGLESGRALEYRTLPDDSMMAADGSVVALLSFVAGCLVVLGFLLMTLHTYCLALADDGRPDSLPETAQTQPL